MTNEIDEEVLNRLEAEATVADADAEELTIAVESDIEQTEDEVEELQAQVEEKESEVEELQEQVEEKEEEIEEMSEKIDTMAESYAEELAAQSEVMDAEDFRDKFDFEELQEKVDSLDTEPASPSPNSGDPGAGFQSPDGDNGGEGGSDDEELSKKAKVASDSFKKRGGVWEELAEDIEENGLGDVRKADQAEEAVFE